MNVADFTFLLQNPDKVLEPVQTNQLEDILKEYPYFQAARALHLKGLKNLNSFKYNNALKVTAACTADRDILFDYITSEVFLQNSIADTISGKTLPLAEKEILSEEVEPNPDAEFAELEKEILERVNKLGIGPQGFGGRTTALAVHIEVFPCHIASMPAAVNLQCHSSRHKEAIL